MLGENKKMFDYVNLTQYHEKGYTGKDIPIFVLEPNTDHRIGVVKSLKQSSPDCKHIFKDGCSGDLADYIIDSGAKIVTCSWGDKVWVNKEESQRMVDAGITMFVAVGNDDYDKHCPLADDPNWISVGAMTYNGSIPRLENYSSRTEVLDTVAFIPYYQGGYVFQPVGTSFASPFLTGMFACYYQYFFAKYGRYPIHEEVVNELIINSKDFGEIGHDINYGNGMWIMPKIEDKFIRLQIDNIKSYVNGIETVLDVTPIIENNRTLVPLRFIAESMGGIVEWDGNTQVVTIIKNDKTTVIKLQINNTISSVNGKQITLDVAPKILNSRTLVPIRFIAENFGCEVEWIEKTKEIIISA